jgi:hypothetical protein
MKFQNFSMQNNLLDRENRIIWLKKGPKVGQTMNLMDKKENLIDSPVNTKTKLHEGIEKSVRVLQALNRRVQEKGNKLSKNSTKLRNHMIRISNIIKKLKSYLKTPKNQDEKIKVSLNRLNTLIHKGSYEITYRGLLRKEKQSSMKEFYNGSFDNPKNLVRMFTLLGKGHGGKTETREFKQNDKSMMKVKKFNNQLFITINKNGKTTKLNYKFTINENEKWEAQKLDIEEGTVKKTLKTVEAKSETVAEKGVNKLKTAFAKLKSGQALQVKLINKNGKTGISTFVKRGNQIYSLQNGKLSHKPYNINDAKMQKVMEKKLANKSEFKIIEESDVIKNYHLNRITRQLANLNGGKKNNLVIRINGAIVGIVQRIRGHYVDRSNGMIPIFKNPNDKNIRIKNIASAFNDNFKNMLAAGQVSVSTIQNRDWRRTERAEKNLSVAGIANKIQLKNNLRRLRPNNQMVVEKGNFEGYKKLTIQKSGRNFKLANEHGPLGKIKRNEVSELGKFINKNSKITMQPKGNA